MKPDKPQRVLVDTVSAAVAVDRPEATIRNWAYRKEIHAHGQDAAGRKLYDLAEVYQASVRFQGRARPRT